MHACRLIDTIVLKTEYNTLLNEPSSQLKLPEHKINYCNVLGINAASSTTANGLIAVRVQECMLVVCSGMCGLVHHLITPTPGRLQKEEEPSLA